MNRPQCHLLRAQETANLNLVLTDFADRVACLEDGLNLLSDAMHIIVKSEELLCKPDLDKNLVANSTDEKARCRAIQAILLVETWDRLRCSVLLMQTGHQSRALSCVRDAFECLRTACVCGASNREAVRFSRAKRIKSARTFKYPSYLSNPEWDKAQEILNVWGTHPYYQAATLGIYTFAPVIIPVGQNPEVRKFYKFLTGRHLTGILDVLVRFLCYLQDTRSDILKMLPNYAEASSAFNASLARWQNETKLLHEEMFRN